MADIDLQRKRPTWGPWIIAALVAILVIWAVTEVFDRDAPAAGELDTDDPVLVQPAPQPGADAAAEMGLAGEPGGAAVAEFRQTCVDTTARTDDMGRQHEWTAGCLEQMAAALDAAILAKAAQDDLALRERLATLRQRAQEVRQADPAASSHAGTVAAAFEAGADLIEAWEQNRGTAGDRAANRVRQAADSLSADQPLLDQRDVVHAYFQAVGQSLHGAGT